MFPTHTYQHVTIMIIKKLLYKYTRLYETYKMVEDVFTEPVLTFTSCKWLDYSSLPVWKHGPIIKFAKHFNEYIDNPSAYGNRAKSTEWDPDFLKTKGWWGRTWRKYIRPHYQLPIWLAFNIYNRTESVKSKWDYFSYEFPPQFSIVLFGWSFNWNLIAPRATTDFLSEKTGRSYPDNDAYWESITYYINNDSQESPLYNAMSTVYTSRNYTPQEREKFNKLFEQRRNIKDYNSEEYKALSKKISNLGIDIAKCACRPEYIKSDFMPAYFETLKKIKQRNKEYAKYIWI